MEAECDPVAMVIVQNKVDLIDDSKVSAEEVEALAKRLRLKLFRTSVKMNFNVDQGLSLTYFEFFNLAHVPVHFIYNIIYIYNLLFQFLNI